MGRVRCCDGVVALSIKMRRKIPLLDEVDAAEEERDRPGRIAVGESNGTDSSLPLDEVPLPNGSKSSTSYSGVVASPPLTALACPGAVAALGIFRAALAGASSN